MKGYGTREVAQILGLSAGQVRAYVRAGFLSPERGSRGGFRFSFEDLVFLRAASGLLKARIGPRRVRRALSRLRDRLPAGRGLTGLRIAAEGDRIVVGDGTARWQPESGQILFDFGVEELAKRVAPLARRAFRQAQEEPEGLSADDWYEWGCELEHTSASEALEAYGHALALDPAHAEAHVNLGRLLHEEGDAAAAEQHYRRALATEPRNATAAFNLGVALEDLDREEAALEAYERAGALDPENADAQYNAANLCERLGRRAAALRHWKTYRTLLRSGSA
ncbi:MAG: tetratricopeptide repeat protein [Thermoanaerobaculia bacterium]